MDHAIATRDDWLAARLDLMQAEKAHMRAGDALAKQRRALPRVRIEKPYTFTGARGQLTLPDLFGSHSQLFVYHFMFGADWAEGCPSCSFWADNFDGLAAHLAARDCALVVVSKAPYEVLASYKQRMGWQFRWVSAGDSGFNEDLGVTFAPEDIEAGRAVYNFRKTKSIGTEMPGITVFQRDGDAVFHTYSTYARGLEAINSGYHILDLLPKGRDEEKLPWSMAWLRRHDQYS